MGCEIRDKEAKGWWWWWWWWWSEERQCQKSTNKGGKKNDTAATVLCYMKSKALALAIAIEWAGA